MNHLFTDKQDTINYQILNSIQTVYEAANILMKDIKNDNWAQFDVLTSDINQLISIIAKTSEPYHELYDFIMLPVTCKSMLKTLNEAIMSKSSNPEKCLKKIEFELIAAIEEAYQQFYFWSYVYSYPEREEKYYSEEIYQLSSNKYINDAVKSGKYKYELAIMVLAYNNLDYTKACIENLLQNIPENINYELILYDNGSTDGTYEFFEKINPNKLFRASINWAYGNAVHRIVESKYLLFVSNDVLIMPGSIENMLKCIKSDDKIAKIVPSTTNVSNLQAVQTIFKNFDDVYEFAKKNNVLEPFRWEERIRLCDPVALMDMEKYSSENGICMNGYYQNNAISFPDDKTSLLLRRRGYKQILQKDAFCYHFGSITIKNNIDNDFFVNGRIAFKRQFGVDPWATGFCYDAPFHERLVKDESGHVEVLGINCGFGSNSLKIKEQIKEYCHNIDCSLSNITDDSDFLPDLEGISDRAQLIEDFDSFSEFLSSDMYNYVVWQTPFHSNYDSSESYDLLLSHIHPGGVLFIESSDSFIEYAKEKNFSTVTLSDKWLKLEVQII